jgi:UDP-N-acetylglucosamine--dolichyl-phosphate N-acetylglucosaminephosphotransferase
MDFFLYYSVLVGLMATWVATRKWILKAPEIGLVGRDMNKLEKPQVPEMGGVSIVFGFVLGVLVYIGLQTFGMGTMSYTPILAALCTVLMACIIGIMDDILGWKAGLRQWQKPIFMLFAAMPMMVINAGHSTMGLPMVGQLELGILFPLVVVPIGIVGASNAFNMIAGYNGLEAGLGAIILSTMGYVAVSSGEADAAALAFIMVGALLAFLYFNWYPAKVFPGDTMTYSVGALMACVAILGNMEKIAVLLFLPYGLDFILQARGRFRREAFAGVKEDGCLEKPFKSIYHLTHLSIAALMRVKGTVRERDVVFFMYGIELAIVGAIYIIVRV